MKIRRLLKNFGKGEKGFTLIELMIVIAILGILAVVIIPNLAGFLTTGRVAAANTEVANVKTAAMGYYAASNATWPTNSNYLVIDVGLGSTVDYLNTLPKAVYGFDENGVISQVDEGPDTWAGIVFDLSDQVWVSGDDETPPDGDQDKD